MASSIVFTYSLFILHVKVMLHRNEILQGSGKCLALLIRDTHNRPSNKHTPACLAYVCQQIISNFREARV